MAIAAARAGKHMVLGKPMAMTVAEADRMVEAVESSGVACFPFQAIGRLRIADLVTRIRAGEIGDVRLIHQTCRWSIAEDWYARGRRGGSRTRASCRAAPSSTRASTGSISSAT